MNDSMFFSLDNPTTFKVLYSMNMPFNLAKREENPHYI